MASIAYTLMRKDGGHTLTVVECSECFALVRAETQDDHTRWHIYQPGKSAEYFHPGRGG